MFESIPPSKSRLIPDFPVLSFTNFAEMNKEEILCIERTANKTNSANDPYNLRKMSSQIFSDLITTIFTDIVNSSLCTWVLPDSDNFAEVKPLLKTGRDRDEVSSYRSLYNTSFLSKVLETACLKQPNVHLSKLPALPKLQSAYRHNHSVETTITKYTMISILMKAEVKLHL